MGRSGVVMPSAVLLMARTDVGGLGLRRCCQLPWAGGALCAGTVRRPPDAPQPRTGTPTPVRCDADRA